jgi:hypothetical protein
MITITCSPPSSLVYLRHWFFHKWRLVSQGNEWLTPRSYLRFDHEVVYSAWAVRILGIEIAVLRLKLMEDIEGPAFA